MLTNLFIWLGWSRDDLKWFLLQAFGVIVSVAGLIADSAFDVSYWAHYIGIPLSEHGLHVILAAAMGIVWIAGRYRRSPLPSGTAMASGAVTGSPAARVGVVLLACVLAGMAASSCSLPLKQRAVAGLQISETALEVSHDAERRLCAPMADQMKGIGHCDGAQAVAIGLTDAVHAKAAALYSRAFDLQGKAAAAAKIWRAGDPVPSDVLSYRLALTDILDALAGIVPKEQTVISQLQKAIDEAAFLATLAGVK